MRVRDSGATLVGLCCLNRRQRITWLVQNANDGQINHFSAKPVTQIFIDADPLPLRGGLFLT